MSDLSRLLDRALENKGNKNSYTSGLYSVAFEKRTWETLFCVYYNNVPVLEGNTLDKEVSLCTTEDIHPYKKLFDAVAEALPEYSFAGEVYERYVERWRETNTIFIDKRFSDVKINDLPLELKSALNIDGLVYKAFEMQGLDEISFNRAMNETMDGRVCDLESILNIEYEKSFKECFLQGECDISDLDDYVEECHNGKGQGLSLQEFLGLNDEEFELMGKTRNEDFGEFLKRNNMCGDVTQLIVNAIDRTENTFSGSKGQDDKVI